MIPRFKRTEKIVNLRLDQEQFLAEHNRLSPINLKATMVLLSRFKIEKATFFKDDYWSMKKMRKPFISWLMASEMEANSHF